REIDPGVPHLLDGNDRARAQGTDVPLSLKDRLRAQSDTPIRKAVTYAELKPRSPRTGKVGPAVAEGPAVETTQLRRRENVPGPPALGQRQPERGLKNALSPHPCRTFEPRILNRPPRGKNRLQVKPAAWTPFGIGPLWQDFISR